MHKDCIVHDVEQGTDDWHALRCGLLTASAVSSILTPTLKLSSNDKTRQHVYEIAAQRINGYTEPTFFNAHMERGHIDEVKARDLYSERISPLCEKGIIIRDLGGVNLGFSPDGVGVIGDFGIEVKSRIQKHHMKTIVTNEVPDEYILQIQTGLLVTGWEYIDYISYCAGLPMWVIRVEPDEKYQEAIQEAAIEFERSVLRTMDEYYTRTDGVELIETERDEEGDIYFE